MVFNVERVCCTDKPTENYHPILLQRLSAVSSLLFWFTFSAKEPDISLSQLSWNMTPNIFASCLLESLT